MKQYLFIILLCLIIGLSTSAQSQYTPYDELPGIDKTYKPSFSNQYSGWQKMLFEYPVNFNRIEKAFNSDIQQNPEQKTAIIRYYKIWSRVVREYVDANGEIILPDIAAINQKQFNLQKNANSTNKSASAMTKHDH